MNEPTIMDKSGLIEEFMNRDDEFWGVEVGDGWSTFTESGFAGSCCTGFARMIESKLGSDRVEVTGFMCADNPTSELGIITAGHDFAIVDDRYIVDPWIVEVENLNITPLKGGTLDMDIVGVYDLEDESDADIIARIYGSRVLWTKL